MNFVAGVVAQMASGGGGSGKIGMPHSIKNEFCVGQPQWS